MKKMYFAVSAVLLFLLSCTGTKKETAKKFTDNEVYNIKGDVQTIQDSTFVVDSTGKVIPDSVSYGSGNYKDGNLVDYTDVDTTGKKTFATYDHYENGLWKGMQIETNGKLTYKLEIKLDSTGKYIAAQSYDSSGKMDYYNTDLVMNEYGSLVSGKLYKGDSSLENSFVTAYDKNIVLGETTMDSSGKVISKLSIKVNEHGDPVQKTSVKQVKDSSITKITSYQYVYDTTGNWTLQTEFNDKGKPVKIIKRVLTYYKKAD